MDLFKTEWLRESPGTQARSGFAAGRCAPRYGVHCEPRTAHPDPTRLLQLRSERASLWDLARRDRAA